MPHDRVTTLRRRACADTIEHLANDRTMDRVTVDELLTMLTAAEENAATAPHSSGRDLEAVMAELKAVLVKYRAIEP